MCFSGEFGRLEEGETIGVARRAYGRKIHCTKIEVSIPSVSEEAGPGAAEVTPTISVLGPKGMCKISDLSTQSKVRSIPVILISLCITYTFSGLPGGERPSVTTGWTIVWDVSARLNTTGVISGSTI